MGPSFRNYDSRMNPQVHTDLVVYKTPSTYHRWTLELHIQMRQISALLESIGEADKFDLTQGSRA